MMEFTLNNKETHETMIIDVKYAVQKCVRGEWYTIYINDDMVIVQDFNKDYGISMISILQDMDLDKLYCALIESLDTDEDSPKLAKIATMFAVNYILYFRGFENDVIEEIQDRYPNLRYYDILVGFATRIRGE